MAGKTLSGIGEDESGKHELALDDVRPELASGRRAASRAEHRPHAPVDDHRRTGAADARRSRRSTRTRSPRASRSCARSTSRSAHLDLADVGSPRCPPQGGHPRGRRRADARQSAAIAAATAAELIRSRGTAHGHALERGRGSGQPARLGRRSHEGHAARSQPAPARPPRDDRGESTGRDPRDRAAARRS